MRLIKVWSATSPAASFPVNASHVLFSAHGVPQSRRHNMARCPVWPSTPQTKSKNSLYNLAWPLHGASPHGVPPTCKYIRRLLNYLQHGIQEHLLMECPKADDRETCRKCIHGTPPGGWNRATKLAFVYVCMCVVFIVVLLWFLCFYMINLLNPMPRWIQIK